MSLSLSRKSPNNQEVLASLQRNYNGGRGPQNPGLPLLPMARPLSPGRSLLRLLEESSTPLFALDSTRRIVFVSRSLGAWLGIEPGKLIGLSCEYHSGGDDPLRQIAAAICPPPEAFAGQVEDGSVSRLAGSDHPFERRPARFVTLAAEDAEEALLLVFVSITESLPPGGPERALSPEQLHAQLVALRDELGKRFHTNQLIGESEAITRVRQQVRIAAESKARVLVTGPPGSGREHVARTIHYAQANPGALIPIVCSLVDAEQMQGTLASLLRRQHESPAAPPPVALLLDVDELGEGAQQELAGFLALPNIELHTLATSHVSLTKLAAKGKFRRDLAYSLGTLTIALPPLHKRPGDIPLLAQHFLEEANLTRPSQLSGFAPAAAELIAGLTWRGNIDELARAVREACESATGTQVTLADLPSWVRLAQGASGRQSQRHKPIHIDQLLAEIEKELMVRALGAARGNKSKAAQLLGISRPRLLRRLAQFGLIAQPAAEEPVIFEPLPEEPSQS